VSGDHPSVVCADHPSLVCGASVARSAACGDGVITISRTGAGS